MNGEDETAAAHGGVLVELPLGDAAPDFNLEKAVCSHGLFMMAPNQWDPHSRTLKRPLRLNLAGGETSSLVVHVSHPTHSAHALHLRVVGTRALSPQQQQSLLSQVRRMLRLSDQENRKVVDFQKVDEKAKETGFGRVFRSPTLFEDMIKCMLLCNCQWSRTLSMAQSLCELQSELQNPLPNASNITTPKSPKTEVNLFAPKTPARKDSNKKSRLEVDYFASTTIANFPSPSELANLEVEFLAKRCNLGYRASRVINLARGVIDGGINLGEIEFACECDTRSNLSDYGKLTEKLRVIDGFGPFTCANVLMCIGYYHVIPTDSETIRHLKQVHAKTSTKKTIERDLEDIYGKYAPFQFLAYWSEVWRFYEEWFGNLSEMPRSSYKLITAANMRSKKASISKRTKVPLEDDKLITAANMRPKKESRCKRTKVPLEDDKLITPGR
ncbi:hypothetical protein ABFS82_14G078400 [Erythranthe guttata]